MTIKLAKNRQPAEAKNVQADVKKEQEDKNLAEEKMSDEEMGPKEQTMGNKQEEKKQKMKLRKEMMQKRQQIRILQQELKAMHQSFGAPKVSKMAANPQPPEGYCFQFQLQKPNLAAEDELYYISVEEAAVWNMMLLKKKVMEAIPKIKQRRFVLKWVGSEGDETTLSNNVALQMVLKETTEPIVK